MIVLHRLADAQAELYLNPDLIQTIEALPDTHIALTTGSTLVVHESPAEVAEAVREWRASVLVLAVAETPQQAHEPDEDSQPDADYPDA